MAKKRMGDRQPVSMQSLRVRAWQEKERQKRELFLALCRQERLDVPTPEYHFAKDAGRRWAFDFAWPTHRIALEVEGGIWTTGAHTRGKHFLSDVEKYNDATLRGWRVFRTTPGALLTTDTTAMLRRAFAAIPFPEAAA